MAIPQSFIDELLTRVDVVEVVGRYVQLRKGGANFLGLCPFHSEKSPSFTVSPSKQFFHCFGCGKNGNAIGFLMEHAGLGFVEAVKELAQQVGLQVPDDARSPQEREQAAARRAAQMRLTDVLERAGESYRRQLRQSPRAIEYLKGRGLSGEIARHFGLGYAPEGWRHLAGIFPEYDNPLLEECGLVIVHAEENGESRRYDRFRDRIMFPIRNVRGECIGFGGRVIGDGTPKYLNSPETPVFSKGRELYGLYEARQAIREAGHVLVTEGYMDVVALAQLGFGHAVATLGTACTEDHVRTLFRFTDAVVFSFDGDAAGRRAARKALEGALPWATDTRSVRFLFLPPEHDPDSYIREHGADAFARCVDEAVPLSRFLPEAAAEGCDLASAEGRARMASQARPLWNGLPDGALKRQILGELAERAALDARELEHLWTGEGASSRPRPGHGAEPRDLAGRGDAGSKPAPRPWNGGNVRGGRPSGLTRPVSSLPGRRRPASRADHAARLLLGDLSLWDGLSGEDHALLCALAEPHGPLFIWLESQLHDHGPIAWSALREDMRGRDFEPWASTLMERHALGGEPAPAEENRLELRRLLDLLIGDRLREQMNEALAANDLERYQSLYERLKRGPGEALAEDAT